MYDASILLTLFNANYHPKTLPPNTITLEGRVSTYELGGHKHLVHNATFHTF